MWRPDDSPLENGCRIAVRFGAWSRGRSLELISGSAESGPIAPWPKRLLSGVGRSGGLTPNLSEPCAFER